ncbi:hypothetical protein MKW92_023484 [Papaver armeniacum]|nr:hypothetical protein MKW92_023484 [Papaver armeniacum]
MILEIVEAKQNFGIQITEENHVSTANSIKLKLDKLIPSSTTTQCSIYRVREKFRKISEFAHSPEMVSIGPFHRQNGSLKAMEDHKLRYAHALLSRTAPTGTNKLEECVASIERIEVQARKCYSEPIDLKINEFVEMMVIDGLFMIELFSRNANKVIQIERGDPIFGKIWGLASVARDLILLENQLPMVVLECLFEVLQLKKGVERCFLNILALQFFDPLIPRGKEVIESSFWSCQGEHLLDLLGKTFHDLPPKDSHEKENSWKSIPNVAELKRAGVKFAMSSTNGRIFIASEQCCDGHVTYMTSYAFFMDSLIDSALDVGVLRKQGIIINYLGDDEDVATLFNKLCREVSVANFYYTKLVKKTKIKISQLCDEVNTYYNTRQNLWRASFKRDHLSSPWKIVSLVGAIVLLVLTFLGSLFAILSYIKQTD